MNKTKKRLNVLVISELYPNPVQPALGIFVEQQTYYNQIHSQNTVVSPIRIFPHLALWKQWRHPQQLIRSGREWLANLPTIPASVEQKDIAVFYPRYTSLPKQATHGLWGYFAYPFVRSTLQELQKKYCFDLIHAHYANPSGIIALLTQRWLKVPIVLSIHGGDVTYTAKQNQLGKRIIANAFNKVDAIIAQSAWTKRQIIQYGGDPDKIAIVRLGANPPVDLPCQAASLSDGQVITILTIAYLVERKGHFYALHAIASLIKNGYKIRYVILGDGPECQHLQTIAQTLGISDYVSFEGYKAHHEIWPYINQCDIFLLPSWGEAFGVAYIEALSLAKPTIGCKGEGGPEDLKALGDCISLVNARDVEDLRHAIEELCNNPSKRQAMGRVGQAIVMKYYNWEHNATQIAEIYEQVVHRYHAQATRLLSS